MTITIDFNEKTIDDLPRIVKTHQEMGIFVYESHYNLSYSDCFWGAKQWQDCIYKIKQIKNEEKISLERDYYEKR